VSETWKKAIDSRFANRDELNKDELFRQFWSDLPEQDVHDAIAAIEFECDVTVGLMRPTDKMATLFEPPPTKNPFKWMEYQVHGGDTDFELSRRLNQRLEKYGLVKEWRDHVQTLDDFVRAWCGSSRSAAARKRRADVP
jgi:hypothetical protein